MRKKSEEGKMLGELRHRAAEDGGSEWRRLRVGGGGGREREREREELCDINGKKNDVILV